MALRRYDDDGDKENLKLNNELYRFWVRKNVRILWLVPATDLNYLLRFKVKR